MFRLALLFCLAASMARAEPVVDPSDPDWTLTEGAAVHSKTGLTCPLTEIGLDLKLARTQQISLVGDAVCVYSDGDKALLEIRIARVSPIGFIADTMRAKTPTASLHLIPDLGFQCSEHLESVFGRDYQYDYPLPNRHDCAMLAGEGGTRLVALASYPALGRIEVTLETPEARSRTFEGLQKIAGLMILRRVREMDEAAARRQ